MDNPGYYAIIPATVRYDDRLTPNAKLLYGEITALSNKEGYCWAGNAYFANLYGVTKTSISTWIGNLKDCGYISLQMQYKEGTKHILNRYIRILGEGIQENLGTYASNLNDPIQEILMVNNTSNITPNITVNSIVDFDSFWKLYPRKAGKKTASDKWNKIKPTPEVMAMIEENVTQRLATGEWDVNNQSFILHASTYLNQARWEDEVIGTAKNKTKTNTDSIKATPLMDKVTDRSWAE